MNNIQADTTPLHTVFGAALGVLISNSTLTKVTTLSQLAMPVLAFAVIALTAVATEACFRRTVHKTNPVWYATTVIGLAIGVVLMFPRIDGRCASIPETSRFEMLLCVDVDPPIFLIGALMISWCISSILIGLYRRMGH